MAHNIHVLLVEHDSKDQDKTTTMLRYYAYEVTVVKLASKALSMLQKDKVKFDLLMVNMNSPDSCVFQLLQDAIRRDMLVILMMSNDEDPATITRAIEQGAFLCIKKPISVQITGYLWQHVVREKVRRPKENGRFIDNNNSNQQFQDQGGDHNNNNDQENYKSKKFVNSENTSQNDNVNFKKKVWTEWSEELHQKFMAAVIQLGEGRCYPRDILELMNEPSLTRMQVASHLQKCRNAGRLKSKDKSSKKDNTETTTPTKKEQGSKYKRFGSMPHVDNYSMLNPESQNHHQQLTVNPPIETNIVHENSGEGYLPRLVFGHDNYHFPQDNETFNMGQLEQTFGVVNESLINEETFEVPNIDSMNQIFSTLQQEIGMNYNGTLQSLVLGEDGNLNQMSNGINAISERNQHELNSANDDQEFEG